jgi:Ca-activated chloride channel homolog
MNLRDSGTWAPKLPMRANNASPVGRAHRLRGEVPESVVVRLRVICKGLGRLLTVVVVAVCTLFPHLSHAGGIFHVFPPTFKDETFAVARPRILLSKTLLTISESFVETRIDQTFLNDNDFPLDGLFILPLEGEQEILEPDVKVNGVSATFELVRPTEFFPILRQLTENMKDPSLLGLAGRMVLLVRPVPVGVKEQKTFRVEYKTALTEENNHMETIVPLDGERFALAPVGAFEILVRFKGSRVVRTIFSDTHHLSVLREAPHRCMAFARAEKMRVRHDFRLLATFSGQDLNLRVLTHKSAGEKGAFIAFVEPPLVPRRREEPEKDVVFVFDSSGSMSPFNLDMAKRTVIFGLESLRPGDWFNVLAVKTHPERLARRLIPATHENVLKAVNFVNSAAAEGGTDLYNSLMNSLEQFRSRKRPCMVVFAGQGRGTVGITEPETIVEDVKRRNKARARIFVLALGMQADMAVLNKIAATNGGHCFHFSEKDRFPLVMNRLYSTVAPPLVSDLSLEFQDITPEGVIPDPIPDLFGSESSLVLGRYDEKGDTVSRVKLKGRIAGRAKTVNKSFTFPEQDPSHPYVPALWAMRRVGRLLERESFKGPEPEARQQIEALTKEFGFKTPFLPGASTAAPQPARGHKDSAGLFWLFKTSRVVEDVESDRYRRVGSRVFHLDNGAWTDNRYRSSLSRRTVAFLSDEYFSLIREEPLLGRCLALGPDVIVAHGKEALIVTSRQPPSAAP